MCRSVDTPRQARHHGDAGVGQFVAEIGRGRTARSGGVTGTDHADATGVDGGRVATHEQHFGGLRVDRQLSRIGGVAPTEHRDAQSAALGERPIG